MENNTEKNTNTFEDKDFIEIVPTVMPTSHKDFVNKIEKVALLVDTIQIDVMDGKFVPSTSWPYEFEPKAENDIDPDWKKYVSQDEGIPEWDRHTLEVDLMVQDQIKEAQNWVSAGVDRIIFHIEAFDSEMSEEKIKEEILKIKDQGVEISMALIPSTPNSILDPYLDVLDSVQFMGINKIGFQGQEFAPEVLEKISELHAKKPELPISVDGGVSFKTARDLVSAGAVRLASGSTIFKAENTERVINDLRSMVN